jgi:hypothetical protein
VICTLANQAANQPVDSEDMEVDQVGAVVDFQLQLYFLSILLRNARQVGPEIPCQFDYVRLLRLAPISSCLRNACLWNGSLG